VQGFAALTMPACQGHTQHMHQHTHAMQHMLADEHGSTHQHPASSLPCDKCMVCALCGALAIMPEMLAFNPMVTESQALRHLLRDYETPSSRLFHPPRTILA
jgi:hypothetical protein